MELRSDRSIHTKVPCSSSDGRYDVAGIQPVYVELYEKHIFVLVAVALCGFKLIFRVFLSWSYELVELLNRLDAYELVWGGISRVGD
jgi:hypothetical protein